MKKTLIAMMAFALTTVAKAETIDTTQFVAVYDYQCATKDSYEKPVTGHAQVVVQVGRKTTKSMPMSDYVYDEENADMAAAYHEAMLHVPTVWTGWPEGKTTVQEFIFPNVFEGTEATPDIHWTLGSDTATVGGYLCQTATATFRGIAWQVYYTEDVPSSAGPWRLRGLPGLIVKAESKAHTFCLAELRPESAPITFERDADVQQMSYAKLLKYRNEVYGNRQYAKNPLYYIPDVSSMVQRIVIHKEGGQSMVFANGHPLLTKGYVHQPLELK